MTTIWQENLKLFLQNTFLTLTKGLLLLKYVIFVLKPEDFIIYEGYLCDAAEIARRVKQIEKSQFRLLNANCQTLLESMRSGGEYYMNLCGNPKNNLARNRKSIELTDYGRSCMEQMKLATDTFKKNLEFKRKALMQEMHKRFKLYIIFKISSSVLTV